jgi:hypothetical protein
MNWHLNNEHDSGEKTQAFKGSLICLVLLFILEIVICNPVESESVTDYFVNDKPL